MAIELLWIIMFIESGIPNKVITDEDAENKKKINKKTE